MFPLKGIENFNVNNLSCLISNYNSNSNWTIVCFPFKLSTLGQFDHFSVWLGPCLWQVVGEGKRKMIAILNCMLGCIRYDYLMIRTGKLFCPGCSLEWKGRAREGTKLHRQPFVCGGTPIRLILIVSRAFLVLPRNGPFLMLV